jgi:hypothetical protein
MCDACARSNRNRPIDRRSLLRRTFAGGAVLAAAWWLPDLVDAPSTVGAAPPDGGDGPAGGAGHPPLAAPVATTRKIPAVAATSLAAPDVISRAEWGADESIRINERQYAPIRKLIVHHTASDNRPANPAAVVRETYRYHVQGRGFSDVGYNFLIDHRGRVYEGRFARRYAAGETITGEDVDGRGVVGAHAMTMNHGSCGVCLIGDFELAAPSDAAIVSLTGLLAWKAGRHRIDALADDVYENLYRSFFRFANISGHRDVGATACPGGRLESRLPAVRRAVAARAGAWPATVVNIPAVVRTERGSGEDPPARATALAPANGQGSATGTKLVGYRAVTTAGTLLGTKGVAAHGRPKAAVAAMAAPGAGDGYAVVTPDGLVGGFGTVTVAGQTAGSAAVVDIAVSADGAAAWVLRADGAVAKVGTARSFGSPKGRPAVAIECRPGGDGYWVLTVDGRVRGYGAARSLGTASGAGAPVDLAITASGGGALVLFDSGAVVALGDAVAAGDLASRTARWTKPAVAIAIVPSGGYVISARDGGLSAFGGAPFRGTFAGSGATVAGLVVACR